MKKRVLTLALVLAMCLSLAIPAFAAEPEDTTDPEATASEPAENTDDEDAEPAESTEPGDEDPEPSESTEPSDEDPEPSESTEPSEPAPEFTDVPEGIYYEEPVKWAVEKEITNGTTPTTFDPDIDCTQAQILTFLWRAAGKPEAETEAPETPYYAKAMAWALEKKIIDDTFDPEKPCTRATAASYIWQAFDAPEVEANDQFTDVTEADVAAVSWMLSQKITDGTTPTTFSPDDVCSRGQIVTFLFRAYAAAEAETPVEPAE